MKKALRLELRYLIMTISVLIMSIGIYFFKFPNRFCLGGVSGISLILGRLFPNTTAGTYMLGINIILLIIGGFIFGRDFGIKTIYCSLLLSLSLFILEKVFPISKPITDEPLLELIFAVLLPAFGSAMVFNLGGTTGGTDIIAMVLKRYTSIHIGSALFFTDLAIVVTGFFVFGIKAGMLSFLGLLSKVLVVDGVIENINSSKYFFIVTTKPNEICDFINLRLHKGATIWTAKGSYTNEEKTVVLAVMTRSQALDLRNHIRSIDSDAFVIISSTSEIIGKGFRLGT